MLNFQISPKCIGYIGPKAMIMRTNLDKISDYVMFDAAVNCDYFVWVTFAKHLHSLKKKIQANDSRDKLKNWGFWLVLVLGKHSSHLLTVLPVKNFYTVIPINVAFVLPSSKLQPLNFVDWDRQIRLDLLRRQFYPKLYSVNSNIIRLVQISNSVLCSVMIANC